MSQPQPPYAAPNSLGGSSEPQTSTLAIVSLVLGIASFLCTFLTGIPAIILGAMANSKIANSGGQLKGAGL